jgi:hypothetical protein
MAGAFVGRGEALAALRDELGVAAAGSSRGPIAGHSRALPAPIRAQDDMRCDDRAMAEHRLPGMSIGTEQWAALDQKAKALGISRTGAIRLAIDRLVNDDDTTLLQQFQQAQRQLEAIKALLLAETARPVAA